MPRFERSRRGRSSRDSRPKRGSSRAKTFEDHIGGRRDSSSRESGRPGRGRRELNMTKVICDSCGNECEVPFKPTSSKPVYCSDCFSKKSKSGSGRHSDRPSGKVSESDLDIINSKLNKIMKALKIE